MKKFLVFLLLMPILVNAETTANGTGDKVNFGGSSGDSSNVTFTNKCAYFWQSDYGLRVTFYATNGTKLGQSVDVFAGTKAPGIRKAVMKDANNKTIFSVVSGSYTQWKHGAYASGGKLKSRIDYIKEGMNKITVNYEYGCSQGSPESCFIQNKYYAYRMYYDMKSTSFNKSKGDPMMYMNYNNRDYMKEYFTTTTTILNYARLAGANINMESIQEGDYYVLLEPLLHLEILNCDSRMYAGYYTSTELGLLHKMYKVLNASSSLKTIPVRKALRLYSTQEIGDYTFVSEENLITANPNYQAGPEKLINKAGSDTSYYGYGMMVVKGNEVQGYIGNGKHQIIYHTIDLNNPFLTVDGKTRTLDPESNWYGLADTVIDKNVYKNKPFLTVTLTPTVIKEIRNDNKTVDFSKISIQTYNVFKQKYSTSFKFNTNTN